MDRSKRWEELFDISLTRSLSFNVNLLLEMETRYESDMTWSLGRCLRSSDTTQYRLTCYVVSCLKQTVEGFVFDNNMIKNTKNRSAVVWQN